MKQQIQWHTATVDEGTLTVWLSCQPDEESGWEGWSSAFEEVRRHRLADPFQEIGHGVGLIRGAITVAKAEELDADELAVGLESLVDQANAQAERYAEKERMRAKEAQAGEEAAAARTEALLDRLRRRTPAPPV